jgi:hypothetical protein
MAAANTDLLKKLSRKWVGQIGSGGVSDGVVTTIPLSSSTNLPTDTAVVATIDRVDVNGTKTASLEETVIGVVSGNNLINCTRAAEGTAQAHNAGAVVEILVTAKGWNDLVDHLLVQHNQLGLHTNITACNVTASGTLTASNINSNVISGGFITNTTTASAVTMNLGVGGSNRHTITLSDSTTSAYVANATVGQAFLIRAVQDATGSRLVSWFPGSTVRWPAATTPTLTTTANKADVFGFLTIAASSYDGFIVGQNL